MKKSTIKPTNSQENESARHDPGKDTGPGQSANRRPIGSSVDWEIPGDVPEEHRRSVTPYAPDEKSESSPTINPTQTGAGSTEAFTGERPRSMLHAQTGDTRNHRSSFPLRGLMVLLLMLGLVGLGYLYFTGHDQNAVTVAVAQDEAVERTVLSGVDGAMHAVVGDTVQEMAILPKPDVQPGVTDNATEIVHTPRIITHVVKKGDTLWDIAEYYVNDPFRYPELTELSKIENPDLIYPGDIVRIQV